MHFFYLDESGDTGTDLENVEQPIFVLGGLSVADKKWNNTKDRLDQIISDYFDHNVPGNFELHSHELLSPRGAGPFVGHPIDRRQELVEDLLGLLEELGHNVHYLAVEKSTLRNGECQYRTIYDSNNPYLLSFDYLITYMNWHVQQNLGQSARGMIVMDQKDAHHDDVDAIIHNRRFDVPNNQKVKWIVEFSYPVNSRRNPMIQLSDLIVLCIRRFMEIEKNYRPAWPDAVRQYYASWFSTIDSRVKNRGLIERQGRNMSHLNDHLSRVRCTPRVRWRRAYGIQRNQ